MKEKKAKPPRRELAKRAFKDPKSSTFMNKTKSMLAAGYSETTAKHYASKSLGEINFTDADYANVRSFVANGPILVENLTKVLQQIAKSDVISAKQYTAMLQHFKMFADYLGFIKKSVEKRTETVMIGIPRQKCRKCGAIMDYMREGEENERSETHTGRV